MVYTNTNQLVKNATKTTGLGLGAVTSAVITSTGAQVAMENDNYGNYYDHDVYRTQASEPQCSENADANIGQDCTTNLWEFMHLYKIGGISVVDFFVIYVLLYVYNSLYLHADKKIILVSAIPITIIYNILTDKKMKASWFIILILLISVIYLLTL